MSSTTATRAPSIHRWRSAAAAGKPACAHPWDLSVTPTTTPCARASSPHWNASCWHAAASHRRPRPGWRSSPTLRAGTIPFAATPVSAIYLRSPMRPRCSTKPKLPKRQTVHQTGSTPGRHISGPVIRTGCGGGSIVELRKENAMNTALKCAAFASALMLTAGSAAWAQDYSTGGNSGTYSQGAQGSNTGTQGYQGTYNANQG